MLLIRSILFNFFLYSVIVFIFLIAIPTLLLPPKFTLLFGKFLGYYVVWIVRFILNTKVEFKGIENIPKSKKNGTLQNLGKLQKPVKKERVFWNILFGIF